MRTRPAEAVFDNWRDRYAVAGTTQATRSQRRGHRAAQELRAAVALLAEWFRICVRHGYIGRHRWRNRNEPRERDEGAFAIRQLEYYRRDRLLDLPYGAAAEELGIAGASMATDPMTGAVEENPPPADDPDWVPW